MNHQPVRGAVAILYRNSQFLLQLRDNNPNILSPGYWAMFGGHIEPDETPEDAVKRELLEEISYAPPVLSKFEYLETPKIACYVYYGELGVEMNQLVLQDGWDMGFWTVEDIRRGDRYSAKAGQVRPLAPSQQRILLDFIAKGWL